MSLKRTICWTTALWLVLISGLHIYLNHQVQNWASLKRFTGWTVEKKKFRVGFIPVTCHLTCPVTDFINKSLSGAGTFEPMRFQGFPEIKESFVARQLPATFILAPLAMSMREQGVPIKIVYLGHRDGTAMMVHKDSDIYRIEDLKGKKIAVPNRYSNQRLLIYKALRDRGMDITDVKLLEMQPPDMPAALRVKAVDAITSGEPFMGQTQLEGYGRILYLTRDVWPNFISCVLAVHEDAIKNNRQEVQELVTGIAKSGKWLDQSMDHRVQAAQIASRREYYNQNPRLMEYVLTKPPDRVKYTGLVPLRKDFEEIEALGKLSGVLNGSARFEDYADPSFVTNAAEIVAHRFELKKSNSHGR